MRLPCRRFLHLAAGAAALLAVARFAWAQSYPSRPITMVVPFAAGSMNNRFAALVFATLAHIEKRTPAWLGPFIRSEVARWKPILEAEVAQQKQ